MVRQLLQQNGFAYEEIYNVGLNSDTVQSMLTEAATQVDPFLHSGSLWKTYAALWAGTNDLALAGRTDSQVYADIVTWCTARRAAGFKVVVSSIIARGATLPGNFETYRASVNTQLRANWTTFADAFVDAAADSRLSDATNTTYFNVDQVHLTTAGSQVYAGLMKDALLTIP